MANFSVGLTNDPPNRMYTSLPASNTYNSYILCAQWPGEAEANVTLKVTCKADLPPSRYIVVLNHQPYLTICELQAFGSGLHI